MDKNREIHAEHTEINERMKWHIIADKQKHIEDLTVTAFKAAREGNVRQLSGTTKKLTGEYGKLERSVEN